MLSTVHRLHLLPLFDNIYYFKDGKIIARGSMHKLLKDSPEFRSLWKKYNNKRKKI
jgi:ABC-type multidrug transport system fused ATPase/permease subunit